VEAAQQMVKLQGEKFDMLQPSGSSKMAKGANPKLQGALGSLEELKELINNHLKVGLSWRHLHHFSHA
jgi:hypothetical protein